MVVVSNLAHRLAGSLGAGDSGGDHGRGPSVFLNGVHPKRTEGEDVRAGTTIDQMAALAIGQETPLPSMELATEEMTGLIGACDVGFSCTYTNTISWKSPTTPLPMEINPRAVFDRLFGGGSNPAERMERIQRERSILDSVTAKVNHLQKGLGAGDRNRVAEYLDNIREIERRIQLAEKQQVGSGLTLPSTPVGIPDDHEEHSKLMMDLIALAYQADITRVCAFMMAREVSYRTFPKIGVPDPFHSTSHHQDNPEKNREPDQNQHLSRRPGSLSTGAPEKDPGRRRHSAGSLADPLYGSAMSNSNVHNHSPLPVFIAGGANGKLHGGRHIKYPDDTPMANLLWTVLEKGGVPSGSCRRRDRSTIGGLGINCAMRLPILVSALFATTYAATVGSIALIEAAKTQDKAALRALLKQHVDVNAAEPDGTTALHWAAHFGDTEAVDLLLKAGANVKATNRYGASPLSEGATMGSGALIEHLLKAGADPNTIATSQGETVLLTASRAGNIEAVKSLLDHGAAPNAKENYRGQTALMWAAAEGHPDVVKVLLAKGAGPNLKSMDRDTTSPKLTSGTPIAPIARGGLTALLFAARQGELESAKALVEGGADINLTDSDGNNALNLSILNTHYDLAQMLLDHGADPNIVNKDGRGALYAAVEQKDVDWSPRPARQENDKLRPMDLIQSLIAKGANVNQRLTNDSAIKKLAQDAGDKTLNKGATPFMRAARSADIPVMRLLLDHGADPKLQNEDGLTALMVAAGIGWADKIQGSEADALEAVKLCFTLGLSVNGSTDKQETALHGAALRGSDMIVKFLVEKGALLDVKNKQGFTPLDIAEGKGAVNGALRPPHETTVALIKQLLVTTSAKLTNPSAP